MTRLSTTLKVLLGVAGAWVLLAGTAGFFMNVLQGGDGIVDLDEYIAIVLGFFMFAVAITRGKRISRSEDKPVDHRKLWYVLDKKRRGYLNFPNSF